MQPDHATTPAATRVRQLLDGYRTTCLMLAAAELGLFEQLARGPIALDALAVALPAHPPALQRFVHALEALGLARQCDGVVSTTALGDALARGVGAWQNRAHLIAAQYLPAWLGLAASVRTGETAFDRHFGFDAWAHRSSDPALGASFDRSMSDDQAEASGALLGGYDFSGARCIVDVGSGPGDLIREVLLQFASPRGIAFDRAAVVERTRAALQAAGLESRCTVLGGSFLESVPAGGDVYLLQHVLHDWDDDACQAILRNCRRAMGAAGRLLVIENLLPERGPVPEGLALLDLHMLAVLGGRERSASEYSELLAQGGFRVLRRLPVAGHRCLIEAEPAGA